MPAQENSYSTFNLPDSQDLNCRVFACRVCGEASDVAERTPTFPALRTQEVSDVIVDPEVLLQHVLPGEGFVTLITAVALHPWMIHTHTHTHTLDYM